MLWQAKELVEPWVTYCLSFFLVYKGQSVKVTFLKLSQQKDREYVVHVLATSLTHHNRPFLAVGQEYYFGLWKSIFEPGTAEDKTRKSMFIFCNYPHHLTINNNTKKLTLYPPDKIRFFYLTKKPVWKALARLLHFLLFFLRKKVY